MTDTYREIMIRLIACRDSHPRRFQAFYDAVWLLCHHLQPGSRLRISERCSPRDIPLFRDVVSSLIIEQPFNPEGGMLEFIDEDTVGKSSLLPAKPKEIIPWLSTYLKKQP